MSRSTTLFDGPWMKWNRADEQSKILYQKLREALNNKDHPLEIKIRVYPQPKPPGSSDPRLWAAFTMELSDAPTIGRECGVYIGEVIHNLRGSIDHLAWIVVRRAVKRRLSLKMAKAVQFPMAKSRDDFWKKGGAADRNLPSVPNEQRAVIERYQPYRRSSSGRAMRHLQQLSNIDKHRLILPTACYPAGKIDMKIKWEGAELIALKKRMKPGQELKKGTKFLTAVLAQARPGQGKVKMNGPVPMASGFRPYIIRPPAGDRVVWVYSAIEGIKETCAEVLREFEALY